jgi:hypothetical protein
LLKNHRGHRAHRERKFNITVFQRFFPGKKRFSDEILASMYLGSL